jgi:NAD(P)-dependent dehydrogenase (short-subunit alcohol dehydrogenase family)
VTDAYLEDLFSLRGQVAVVIGGTGVLCGAQAIGLGRAGAHVVVAGRHPARGEAIVGAIVEAIVGTSVGASVGATGKNGSAEFAAVDVSSRESIQALADGVVARHGAVDVLINGAGVNHASEYLDIDDADWSRVLKANLDGVHLGCQVFGRHMIEQPHGGSILNIASVSARTPLSRVFAYSASKAAVLNLTQNVAREFAPHGVRVNAICPGFFPAEQNRKILDPARIANIMGQTPMNRFGEPDELIGATLLLASRKAGSFITGSSLYVDGGFTAMTL